MCKWWLYFSWHFHPFMLPFSYFSWHFHPFMLLFSYGCWMFLFNKSECPCFSSYNALYKHSVLSFASIFYVTLFDNYHLNILLGLCSVLCTDRYSCFVYDEWCPTIFSERVQFPLTEFPQRYKRFQIFRIFLMIYYLEIRSFEKGTFFTLLSLGWLLNYS